MNILLLKDRFDKSFKDSDVCILSSYLDEIAIAKIIQELPERFYNIGRVFFSNSVNRDSEKITTLHHLSDNSDCLLKMMKQKKGNISLRGCA